MSRRYDEEADGYERRGVRGPEPYPLSHQAGPSITDDVSQEGSTGTPERYDMSITDLTSMAEAEMEARREIDHRLQKLSEEVSDYCFQCAKCTSGCEAHKLLELEPHRIVALLKRGLVQEMINSDDIWTCMSCFKCKERCPQKIAPVNILFALKNLAVASGKQVPGEFTGMMQSAMGIGLVQDVQTVTTRDGGTKKREELGLPPPSRPKDPEKFQATIMSVAVERI
ncbi:MAG: 4Fe-4S dicluster domain-containing protein [Thermoplasmatota archaeon]